MTRWSLADRAAVLLAVGMALIATLSGLQTGYHSIDVDEQVYRDTLVLMQHGQDYYGATRTALITKERRPPRSVRAIRPPTMFLALRWAPASWWRWLAGLVYLVDLLLVWRLARFHGGIGAPLAVAVAGLWLFGFSAYLFLHAETWALPLLLAGLLAARRRLDVRAAAWFLGASCVRETFGLALVLGLGLALWRRERLRPWLVALIVAGGLFAVHAHLAQHVLDPRGFEAKEGNEHRTLHFMLGVVSPWLAPIGYAVGIGSILVGLAGSWRWRRVDRAALLTGAYVAVMVVASEIATRVYWSAAWALPASSFVGAALGRPRQDEVDPSQR